MDRKLLLAYLKLKVIMFVLVVVLIPTSITIYIDMLVTKLLVGTDPFTAIKLLLDFVLWKSLLFLYCQSLFLTFLISLVWNVGKVIYKKENREFFLMK